MTETTRTQWAIRIGGEDGLVLDCDDRIQAERKVDVMAQGVATVVAREVTVTATDWEDVEPCPYTHAHTRHWCGRKYCRDR